MLIHRFDSLKMIYSICVHACVYGEGCSLKKKKLNIKKQLPSKSSKVVRQINEHKNRKK